MELRGSFCLVLPTVRPPAATAPIIKRIWETATHPTDLLVLNGERGKSATLNAALRRHDWGTDYYVTIDDDILLPQGWQDDVIKAHKIAKLGAVGLDLSSYPGGAEYMMEVNAVECYQDERGSVLIRPLYRQNIAGVFISMISEVARSVPPYPHQGTRYEFDEDGYRCGRVRQAGHKLGYVVCSQGTPEMVKHDDAAEYLAMKDADTNLIRHKGVAK